jgi:single-stranded-DNA-specific exonuclease
MAAGLSLAPEKLETFRERFDSLARERLGKKPQMAQIKTDGELSISRTVEPVLLRELDLLQPFGLGNAEPVFTSPPLRVRDLNVRPGLTIMDVTDEETGITLKAKIWRPKEAFPPGTKGRRVCLAYSPRLDRYNGVTSVELRVRDWQFMD